MEAATKITSTIPSVVQASAKITSAIPLDP
jgi:hypothetical protein